MLCLLRRQLRKLTVAFSTHTTAPKPYRHHFSQRHFIEHLTSAPIAPLCTAEKQGRSDLATVLSFLETSCSLSAKAALSITEKLKSVKSIENVESVVAVLKEFNFSNADIAALIARRPILLNSDAEKSLRPKLELFRRIGLQPKSISSNTELFYTKLQSRMLTNLELLKSFLPTNEKLIELLKIAPSVMMRNLEDVMLPKINALREYNVPESVIIDLVVHNARGFFSKDRNVVKVYEEIKQMGISPCSPMFIRAFGVLIRIPEGLRDEKLENYEKLGWSKDQVMTVFTKHPYCMAISKEKAKQNMEFFSKKLNWGPEHLSAHPSLLCYSLEKRVVPRYAAWRILASKGLVKDIVTPKARYFMISEKQFVEEYVTKYQKEAPELLDVMKTTVEDQSMV